MGPLKYKSLNYTEAGGVGFKGGKIHPFLRTCGFCVGVDGVVA